MMQLLKEEIALGQKQAAAETMYDALKAIDGWDFGDSRLNDLVAGAIAKAEGRT